MQINKFSMMLLSVMSCVALLNGCGSSSKEGTSGGVALVDEGTCIVCHSTTTDPVSGTNLSSEYATSAHNLNVGGSGCQGCHGGGAEHNGVGPIPFPNPLALNATTSQPQCLNAACHGTPANPPIQIPGVVTTLNTGLNFVALCSHCHTTTGNSGLHGAQVTAKVLAAQNANPDDCVYCHSVGAPQHGSALVNDNSGVRAITGTNGEFGDSSRVNAQGYRSHHIYNGTNAPPQAAQCIVCHLEGKANGSSVAIDTNYHMKNGQIHLRDGNSALTYPESTPQHTLNSDGNYEFTWDPAKPNHQAMDQFCMSCHNGSGAVTAFTNVGPALLNMTAIPGALPLSAKNPFGDQLTNAYDQRVRPAVVDVYDQMNPANASHHAVRGQKYTGRTRTAGDPRVSKLLANFTQYSGVATGNDIHPNALGVLTSYQVFGTYSATTGPASGSGPKYPGSRTTMYDAGLFVANYTTLSGATVGDDSTLHCGDCHSVGQWTAGSANAITWANISSTTQSNFTVSPTKAVIGAHGAQNEYMLRTSDGSDSLQHQSTTGNTNSSRVDGNYVCFLCHTQYYYGDNSAVAQSNVVYGTNAKRGDFGHGGGIGPCNGNQYSGYGKIGTARYGVIGAITAGVASPSIGNIFAMACLHCHNSGQQNYGGIHGATTTYLSYSTNGLDVAGNVKAPNDANKTAFLLNATHKTSYRFMGGESNRYNGGATANRWETQTPGKPHREGCYNLSATTDQTHMWNTAQPLTAAAPGAGIVAAIQNNSGSDSAWGVNDYTTTLTGRYGQNNATSGWGSCNHHQGSTTTGPTAPTRVIQRPLVY